MRLPCCRAPHQQRLRFVGVEDVFDRRGTQVSQAARSVKVPPTSIPKRRAVLLDPTLATMQRVERMAYACTDRCNPQPNRLSLVGVDFGRTQDLRCRLRQDDPWTLRFSLFRE